MDASAWIALGGLAFVILGQSVVFAFLLGGVFQRVQNLEVISADHRTTSNALIRLEGEVRGLTKEIKTLADGMDWIVRVPAHGPGGAGRHEAER